MRIDKDSGILYAEEGKMLRRKSDGWEVGSEISLGYTYYIGGKKLDVPHLEVPEDYEEVDDPYVDEQDVMDVWGNASDHNAVVVRG